MAAIIPAAAIGAAVGAELPKFFNDSLNQLGSGEGVYLRDGEPEGIVAKVGQAVGRAYCRSYDSVSSEYPPGRGERIEAACRPYLDAIGSNGGPGLKVAFRGGQCPSRYRVEYTTTNPTGIQGGTTCVGSQSSGVLASERWGPLGAPFPRVQRCSGGPQGSAFTWSYTNFGPASGPRLTAPVTSDLALTAYTLAVQSVTLIGGGDDNCGNPVPTPITPPPTPNPQPPPFRFNPDPDIDIDIDVNINPDGTFNFNIGTGPINVDPFDEDDGGGPGDGGGPDPTPDPGTPGNPQDTGAGGGGADGDAPEGKVLTGVRIDVLEAPPSRRRFTEEVDRGVAYVYMGTPAEGLGLEPTGSLVRSGQFFFAQKDYLTRHSVRANVGYNVRVTPYYRDKVE